MNVFKKRLINLLMVSILSCNLPNSNITQEETYSSKWPISTTLETKTFKGTAFEEENQSKEIIRDVQNFVNYSDYKIASIRTSYINEHLVGTKVTYSPVTVEREQRVFVRFYQSKERSWKKKEEEMNEKLRLLRREKYLETIHEIKAGQARKYTVALEAYFTKK